MKPVAYYSLRLGLLGVLAFFGLIAYAPGVLDWAEIWNGGAKEATYVAELESSKDEDNEIYRNNDVVQMNSALQDGITSTKYVFSKNKFSIANQRAWWPPLYKTAIEAANLEVFEYLLRKNYDCDYSNPNQGFPAFKSAVSAVNDTYLALLVEHGCVSEPPRFRPNLKDMVAASKYPERVALLP